VLTDLKKRRANDIPRTLHFQPYDLLRAIHRSPGGREYELLRGSLRRLQSSTISTNIRAHSNRKKRQFSWIDSWTEITSEDGTNVRGMSLTISDWLYEGILMEGGILAIDPDYFSIKGGRERWLYRVSRKHAGGHDGVGFAISLPTLFDKAGAEGTYRRFKHEIKRITDRNNLPEFFLLWEEREGRTEPDLRMIRRSNLTTDHPGYELPVPRTRKAELSRCRAVPFLKSRKPLPTLIFGARNWFRIPAARDQFRDFRNAGSFRTVRPGFVTSGTPWSTLQAVEPFVTSGTRLVVILGTNLRDIRNARIP
jgi:hypothetical protein